MLSFNLIHKTPSTEVLVNLQTILIKADMLEKYEHKNEFENLCADGCPNYNNKWSCPPFSPSYSHTSKEYSNIILMLLYCDLSQFDYIKTEYMKIKASNSILKSKSEKLARFLEEDMCGVMITNGSCKLCKPCNRKKNLNCKRPKEMRYSLEALGLNVGLISKEFFNHELLWYENKLAPKYSSVITGVLTNKQVDEDYIANSIEMYIKD